MNVINQLLSLHEENEQDNLIIFLGAGISEYYSDLKYFYSSDDKPRIKNGKKFPSWEELVKKVVPDDIEFKDVSDYLRQVQIYEDNYSKEKVAYEVKQAFPEEYDCFDIHKMILDVNPEHIITTNYDHLVEKAINDKWSEKYQVIDCDSAIPFSRNKKNFFVKAHGDLYKENIVFSEKDYNDYELNFPLILSFLRYAFSKYKILFIGFSLNDPNFNKILYWVKNILHENSIRHTVIFDSEISQNEINYFSKRSIDVITKKNINSELVPLNVKNKNDNNDTDLYLFKALQVIKDGNTNYGYSLERSVKLFEKNSESHKHFQILLPSQVNQYLKPFLMSFSYSDLPEEKIRNILQKRYSWKVNFYARGTLSSGFDFTRLIESLKTDDSEESKNNNYLKTILTLFLKANFASVGPINSYRSQSLIESTLDKEYDKELLTYQLIHNNEGELVRIEENDCCFYEQSKYFKKVTFNDGGFFSKYAHGNFNESYQVLKKDIYDGDDKFSCYLYFYKLSKIASNEIIGIKESIFKDENKNYLNIFEYLSKSEKTLIHPIHTNEFLNIFRDNMVRMHKSLPIRVRELKNTTESGFDTQSVYWISYYIAYSRILKFVIYNELPIIHEYKFQECLQLANDYYLEYFFNSSKNEYHLPNWVLLGILLESNTDELHKRIIKLHNKNYVKSISCKFDCEYIYKLFQLNIENINNKHSNLNFKNILLFLAVSSEECENFDFIVKVSILLLENNEDYFLLISDVLSLAIINFLKSNDLQDKQKYQLSKILNKYIFNVVNNNLEKKVVQNFEILIGTLGKINFPSHKDNNVLEQIKKDNLSPDRLMYTFEALKILGYSKNEISGLVKYIRNQMDKFKVTEADKYSRENVFIENEVLVLSRIYDIDFGTDIIFEKYKKIFVNHFVESDKQEHITEVIEWLTLFLNDEKFKIIINTKDVKTFKNNFEEYVKGLGLSVDLLKGINTKCANDSFELFIKMNNLELLSKNVASLFNNISIYEFIAEEIDLVRKFSDNLVSYFIKAEEILENKKEIISVFSSILKETSKEKITAIEARPLLRILVKELGHKLR